MTVSHPSPHSTLEKSRRVHPSDSWPRARRAAGPLLLYLLMGLGLMFPFRSSRVRPVGDLPVVMAITMQAERALIEGQFPIRVAPTAHGGYRFPTFQFYGNLPYTVAGALSVVTRDPYTGWKITSLISLLCAGYFTMQLSRWLSGSQRAATVAGAVFLCAPYLMTDLNARGAFTELVAFCLMPAAFYATLRCLASRRWRRILWCAFAWTLIGLTHNITYLYGVLFTGLFCVPFLLSRHAGPRLVRLGVAGLIHTALMLWYLVPQFHTVKLLQIGVSTSDPFFYAPLTKLHILLASVLTNTPEGATTPSLGLQVGWPILGGVILALLGLVLPRRTPAPRRRFILLLLGEFAVAFFLAWSPFDFWKHLPTTLWFAQFPYRMLLFVVLSGATLSACGLARLFPRRVPFWATPLVLAGVGLALASYIPRGPIKDTWVNARRYSNPQILDRLTEYLTTPQAMAATNVSDADPDNLDWAVRQAQIDARPGKGRLPRIAVPISAVRYGARTHCDFVATNPAWLELPILYYPGLLGVYDNGRRVHYYNSGRFLTLPVSRGPHKILVTFAGVRWANVVSIVGWIVLLAGLTLPLWQRLADMIGTAVAAGGFNASTAFSARDALIAFVVLLLCALLPLYSPLRRFITREPALRVTATPSILGPQYAFDDDPETEWVAADSGPAMLTVEFSHAATLHGLIFHQRLTSLCEGWEHVAITLSKDGREVYNADFDFADAAQQPIETIQFPPATADRMELRFSRPVLTTLEGGHVTADMVKPGYREIRILWGK
jgi:hypothetical protein